MTCCVLLALRVVKLDVCAVVCRQVVGWRDRVMEPSRKVRAVHLVRTRTMASYKIVRHYFRGGHRTICKGLTLEEAQAHCKNPETSSSTCTSAAACARTRRMGPWFDGYTEE